MGVQEDLRRAVADVAHVGAAFALVGGFAVSARVEPRFTRDVDLAVAVDDDRAGERLVGRLQGRGWRILALVEQDAVGRLATARLIREDDPSASVLDLLLASSGIEAEIVAAAEVLHILDGLRVPVATVGHLLAQKLLARDDRTRPQDIGDLRALLTVATEGDLETARSAVSLIQVRGYARDRDLLAALRDLIATR